MTKEKLKEILDQHKMWLNDDKTGKIANLNGANLRYADLRHADLRCAYLKGADLRYADLEGAGLTGADLRYADLRYANLKCASLSYADLRNAKLKDAGLTGADLRHTKIDYSVSTGWSSQGLLAQQQLKKEEAQTTDNIKYFVFGVTVNGDVEEEEFLTSEGVESFLKSKDWDNDEAPVVIKGVSMTVSKDVTYSIKELK